MGEVVSSDTGCVRRACLFAFSHTLRSEKDTPMTTPSPYGGESKLLHLPAEIALVRRPRDTGYSTSCILVGPHDQIDRIVVVATFTPNMNATSRP